MFCFDLPDDTPAGVMTALVSAFMTRRRVRVFLGNTETGEQWLEDYDVIGYVGRSCGSVKVPLLVHNRRSHGGPAILTGSIIRIVDVATKRDLYRAENYRLPVLTVVELAEPLVSACGTWTWTHEVYRDTYRNDPVARFPNKERADNWVAWQHGRRMRAHS